MGMSLRKPGEDEYAPFYAGYMKNIEGEDAYELLRKQRDNFVEILKNIPEEKAGTAYAEGKWTIKQLFGHLIDTERVMSYRALCIARGEKQSLPGFDQNDYVSGGNFNSRKLADLIEDYKAARNSTIHLFDSFDREIFNKTGTANNYNVSVLALLYIIVGHERHHINVLMARYL